MIPSNDVMDIKASSIVKKLKDKGFDYVKSVDFTVAVSQMAAAEALDSSSVLMAYLPPTTYLSIENESIEPILVGRRNNTNVDSLDIADWNSNIPNVLVDTELVSYFYGNIISGPSERGKKISLLVDKNIPIVWNDIKDLTFCMGSNVTSGLTYIYPNLWLESQFSKTFDDFDSLLPLSNLTEIIASLAAETCDIGIVSGVTRSDYEKDWLEKFDRPLSVWEETRVIGVTKQIEAAMFVISKSNPNYSDELKVALIESFLEVASQDIGVEGFNSLNLEGIDQIPSNYLDSSREAYQFMANR